MFRIRCLRLLSPYVNAIILEIAWSFVCPDTCVRWFTPTVRTLSTRVYSPRTLRSTNAPTIATSPNESPRVARRLSITSFELPRYTTVRISGGHDAIIEHAFSRAVHSGMRFLSVAVTVPTGTYNMLRWPSTPGLNVHLRIIFFSHSLFED